MLINQKCVMPETCPRPCPGLDPGLIEDLIRHPGKIIKMGSPHPWIPAEKNAGMTNLYQSNE
jgi:hypothetical protein